MPCWRHQSKSSEAAALTWLHNLMENDPMNHVQSPRTDDATIEQEIHRRGLSAPRITPADIADNIASEHYFIGGEAVGVLGASHHPSLDCLTFCVLVLRNGFTVTGESACASPENFDAEIGRRIARENAVGKVWPLMGYELKERLFQATLMQSAAIPEHWNADGSPRLGNPLLG